MSPLKQAAALSAAWLISFNALAQDSCSPDANADEFRACFSVGAGLGLSSFSHDSGDSSWQVDEDSDTGFKVFAAYQFQPNWFAELSYNDLGEVSFNNAQPLITEPAAISYKATSLFAGYYLPLNHWFADKPAIDVFVKAGVSSMSNAVDNDMLNFADEDKTSLALGAGVQWRFTPRWAVRGEFESLSKEANFFSFSALYRFGSSSKKTTKASATAASDAAKNAATEQAEMDTSEDVAMITAAEKISDSDGDGVADNLDKCPQTATSQKKTVSAESVNEQGCAIYKADIAALNKITSGSAELSSAAYQRLAEIADILQRYPDTQVEIQGHADNIGTEADNLTLSKRRAENAKQYLLTQGADAKQISLTAFGESQPIADNNQAAGRALNRRVSFKLQEN